jgi:hypothetical protein
MELMDVLENRRAVREYTDAPVERSMIERLKPSGPNSSAPRDQVDRFGSR